MKKLFALLAALLALCLCFAACAEELAADDTTEVIAGADAEAALSNDAALGGEIAEANGVGVLTVKNKLKVSLFPGQERKLKVKGQKIKSVKSSAKGVVMASKDGYIDAIAPGKATVTVTTKSGKKLKLFVTVVEVTAETEGFAFFTSEDQKGIQIWEGDTYDLFFTTKPLRTRDTVEYAIADPGIATIRYEQYHASVAEYELSIKGLKVGETSFTVTASNGVSLTIPIVVKVNDSPYPLIIEVNEFPLPSD